MNADRVLVQDHSGDSPQLSLLGGDFASGDLSGNGLNRVVRRGFRQR